MSATSVRPGAPVAGQCRAAEFFAGVGLARMGLERAGMSVCWSNDMDSGKRALYERNFPDSQGHTFDFGDVAQVRGDHLPPRLALAWASSPCTDLSLAGGRGGIHARESRALWHFTRALGELAPSARPPVVTVENVTGLATSRSGRDLREVVERLNTLGYSVDILVLDARRFVPQSRPRLFLVGARTPPRQRAEDFGELRPAWLRHAFASATLRTHLAQLPTPPPFRSHGFGAVTESLADDDPRWWPPARVARVLESLSPLQADRLAALRAQSVPSWRTAYRRTRRGAAVWEIRADDIAGCLRTSRGGSSRQAVVQLGQGRVRVRWMTPRECARLMGAEGFVLGTARESQALFGLGDAVCVPVVTWLTEHYLIPLLAEASPTVC